MGHAEVDGASKTITFEMFGEVSTGTITIWEPGHRYQCADEGWARFPRPP